MEVSCLELALEGERLCKVGDYRAGVSFFEAAIQVGTEDLQVLSAIYSQLGNAYFHLHDYAKAQEFHRHDLTLTRWGLQQKLRRAHSVAMLLTLAQRNLLGRTIGDLLGEAKASGNLGNTLKVLGRFDEAVVCCQRHLDISRDLNDKVSGARRSPLQSSRQAHERDVNSLVRSAGRQVGQARALYNFGNVYHAKGKSICWGGAEPGCFQEEVMAALREAAHYYE